MEKDSMRWSLGGRGVQPLVGRENWSWGRAAGRDLAEMNNNNNGWRHHVETHVLRER